MGAVYSVYEGCFGDTQDQTQARSVRGKRNEQNHFSDLRSTCSPERKELKVSRYNDDSQTKTKKRFSFTSNEFELIQVLVKGSFGKVFLVRRKSDNEFLVLKILKRRDIGVKNLLSCTIAEKSLMKDIDHPFILHLQDSYDDRTRVYLLTEFCPGGNISQRIKKDRRFDLNTTKIFAAELVLAIQYIHESLNMIHRDINPENILLASDCHIRITDFGFSKTYVKGITCYGTPNYLAPEIVSGHAYGPEVDWWSLGCLIYFMLVGKPLFEHQKPNDLIGYREPINQEQLELPVWFSSTLKALLTGLLKRKPKERLGTKGAQQIKNHPFFKDLDWDAVLNKGLIPSIKIPTIEQEIADYSKDMSDKGSLDHQLNSSSLGGESFTLTQCSYSKVSLSETQGSFIIRSNK